MTRIDSSPGSISSLSRDLGWMGVRDSNSPGPFGRWGCCWGGRCCCGWWGRGPWWWGRWWPWPWPWGRWWRWRRWWSTIRR